jgi:hypothetical protein
MKNRNVTFTTILFTLGYLALCPITQAVKPHPTAATQEATPLRDKAPF